MGKLKHFYEALLRRATEQFGRKPEFLVQVVSDYNGNGRRLQWGNVPRLSSNSFPNVKFYGRYACFPLRVSEGEELSPEDDGDQLLEVPRRLLEEVREAFLTGNVDPKTTGELRDILVRKA